MSLCGVGRCLCRQKPGDRAWDAVPHSGVLPWVPGSPSAGTFAPSPPRPWPRSPSASVPSVCGQTCWQAAGLARTQRCLTLPPFGFLIAEKFIRSQTIASSKMPRENNQASRGPAVRLPLLNGRLNGARWCLGALPGQIDDGCQPGPAGRGARAGEIRACLRCPARCPSVPFRAELTVGRAATCLTGPVTGQSWARLRQGSAGARKHDGCKGTGGSHSLHRPRECQRWPGRRHCFLARSWWRGKLFVTMLLPSHLFTDEHLARTAEEKAMPPSASSPGGPSRPCLPRPLTRRHVPPLGTPLSGEGKKPRGLYKDLRIEWFLLLFFLKIICQLLDI